MVRDLGVVDTAPVASSRTISRPVPEHKISA
jgi:hypothetical protein